MGTIKQLRYWAFKILPLAYDDSLSYYEVLSKVTAKLNEVVDTTNTLPELISKEVETQLKGDGDIYTRLFSGILNAIATNEGEGTYTPNAKEGGELIWLNGTLYKVVSPMAVGVNYVVGTNIAPVDISEELNDIKQYITGTRNEHYAERSANKYDTGEYLFWKDALYKTTKDIAINDILTTGNNGNLTSVDIGKEISNNYTEMHEADNNLQTQIDGNDGDIEALRDKNELQDSVINSNFTQLNNRLNAITAQSGSDNTEVVDARIGAEKLGSVSYASLGEAIRQQITRSLNVYQATDYTTEPYNNPDNYPANTIIPITTTVSPLPEYGQGLMITLSYAGATQQLYFPYYTNNLWIRQKWGETGDWKEWTKVTTDDSELTIKTAGNALGATTANIITDCNSAVPNRIYRISTTSQNAPEVNQAIMLSFTTEDDITEQIAVTYTGLIYSRSKWGGADWTDWITYTIKDEPTILKTAGNALGATTANIYSGDLNECTLNRIIRVAPAATNKPDNAREGLLITFSTESDIMMQILMNTDGTLYTRMLWGTTWSNWITYSNVTLKYRPSVSLFRTIGIIGDSYASGEIWINDGFHDIYEQSWGQIMARNIGATAYNFSSGGKTAHSFLNDTSPTGRGIGLLENTEKCDVYLIVLGINDAGEISNGSLTLGTSDDIGTDNETFYGYFSKIITSIQSYDSNAHIIIMPPNYAKSNSVVVAETTIAEHYSLPCVYMYDYQYFHSTQYQDMVHGHPKTVGYAYMAKQFEDIIGDAMADNIDYFNNINYES